MHLISITLSKYKRMRKSHISSITLTPTEAIQIIIGTNGSGKTSLMGELSPLPASASDFEIGGSKKIVYLHEGLRYELTSTFNEGSKPGKVDARHSFLKENEVDDLNASGNVGLQLDLVKKHFGITPNIQKILTYETVFTAMSPTERRYWITELSETNYDYALGVFKRTTDRHRDIVGARRRAEQRLTTEMAKTMSEADRKVLEEETEILYDVLQKVTEVRQPTNTDEDAVNGRFNQTLGRIEVLGTQVIRLKNKISLHGFTSVEQIEDQLREQKAMVEVSRRLAHTLYEEYLKVSKTITDLSEAGEKDAHEIKKTRDELIFQQHQMRVNRNILKTGLDNPAEVMRAFDTVRPAIEAIMVELPENSDRRFTPTVREQRQQDLRDWRDKALMLERNIREWESKKSHLEAHQKADLTECPNCGHAWKLNFNELVYQDVCRSLEVAKPQLVTAQAEIVKLEAFMVEIDNYLRDYRAFFTYKDNWPILNPLWHHLVDSKYLLENPKKAMMECSLFQMDLTSEMQCARMQEEINTLARQLELKNEVGEQDVSRLKDRVATINVEMHAHALTEGVAQKEVGRLDSVLADLRTMQRLYTEVTTLTQSAQNDTSELVEHGRRLGIQQTIRELQRQLARKEDILNSVRLQVGILEDLGNQINQMRDDEQALAMIMKELSPKDGLIARGLLGFIAILCAQMNSFIGEVWTYPLEIVPCEIDENGQVDLDYKFPLRVDDQDEPVPDVKMGSTAMRSIVNIAFVVTAMEHMGLSKYPLFLDEFAGSMDNEHRFTITQAVKKLVEVKNHAQLFIIAQFLELNGAFPNAQWCVLHKDNVAVPKGMLTNQHVHIEA